jgi:hypothetical protein
MLVQEAPDTSATNLTSSFPCRHLLGRIQQHQAASLSQALSQQGGSTDGATYALQLLARYAQQLDQPFSTGAGVQVPLEP